MRQLTTKDFGDLIGQIPIKGRRSNKEKIFTLRDKKKSVSTLVHNNFRHWENWSPATL